MKTPELEKSIKGVCWWIIWKLGLVVYFICIIAPVSLYISTLFILGIERESTPTLSITMAIALHPAVTLPIGVLAKVLGGQRTGKLFRSCSNTLLMKILLRTLTYSLNCHFALIAGLIYYLLQLWIIFKDSTSLNFSNKPFNQCICEDILPQYNVTCTNEETANSFQNKFIGIPNQVIILAFLLTSITCHIIHSMVLVFPPPLTLFQFVSGRQPKPEEKDAIAKRDLTNSDESRVSKGVKMTLCLLGAAYVAGLIIVPYYTFDSYQGNGNLLFVCLTTIPYSLIVNPLLVGICQTLDNYDCQFPFTYQGRNHYYCTTLYNSAISSGSWCSIFDQETKSVGECKSSCPKRKFLFRQLLDDKFSCNV